MLHALAPSAPVTDTDAWKHAELCLKALYGDHPLYQACLLDLAARVAAAKAERPPALSALDAARAGKPDWFLQPGRPAYCTYIDRFAGTLKTTTRHLDYLQDLNVGIFHPLPLLKPRDGNSDGGFAVSDYRSVDPRLGTMEDLRDLAVELRRRDMSLVLDMVCNHTAREHTWAQKMLAGDPDFADFYVVIRDRAEVDEWEEALQDIFPDTAPGSFTFDEAAGGWVWTTFYPFQWDLNYANPRVFVEMVDCLFFLANAGVEGFRLDSTAYLWKRKGTISRNLPETHLILQAMRSLLTLVAPPAFLLAEAIESQASVLPFFGTPDARECDLAYNNGVMTALWGGLADQKGDVLAATIVTANDKPVHGHWLNYVRCHDDIIWLALKDMVPPERLAAWSDFFAGKGSYAKGQAFQAPAGFPPSGCGMSASLCGGADDPDVLKRLKLLYGLTYALEGVPLLYMGDEIALENFEDFRGDPDLKDEIRWLHRPQMDWNKAQHRSDPATLEGGMYGFLKTLAQTLSSLLFRPGQSVRLTADPAIIVLERPLVDGRFLCIANLSGRHAAYEALGQTLVGPDTEELPPYAVRWLIERT